MLEKNRTFSHDRTEDIVMELKFEDIQYNAESEEGKSKKCCACSCTAACAVVPNELRKKDD